MRRTAGSLILLALLILVPLGLMVTDQAAAVVMLYEDFEDGMAQDFTPDSENWWVEGGHYRCHQEGYQILSTSTAGDATWTDYRLETLLQTFGSPDHIVRFRLQPNGDCYELNLVAAPFDTVWLNKRIGGGFTALTTVPLSFSNETWYNIEITVLGPEITVLLNGQPLLSVTDMNDPYLGGGIALVSYTGGLVTWEDLFVEYVVVESLEVATEAVTFGQVKALYR